VGAWRGFYWTLVGSPLLLLGWIGFSARVLPFAGVAERADPPGFDDRIESWAPFVRAAREVGMDHGFEDRVRRLLIALKAIPQDPKPVPAVEFGSTYNTDLRRPLYVAQMVVAREAAELLEAMKAREDRRHLAEILAGSVAMLQGTKSSDVVALIEANRRIHALVDACGRSCRSLPDEQLAWLVTRLIAIEERRVPATEILRNDVALFAAIIGSTESEEALEALELVRQAYKAAKSGKDLSPFRSKAERIPNSILGDRVRSLLIAWDVALKQEEENRRLLLDLILDLREEQILRQGLNPDEVPNRGLPASILPDRRMLAAL